MSTINNSPESEAGYFYHGTIRGNLHSIMEHGLVVGGKGSGVWKESQFSELRQHSDKGVYLSENIHMAEQWALSAYAKAKGPRNGKHRQPVVIAIPKSNIDEVVPDEMSRDPESYRTEKTVQVTSSFISMFPHKELEWITIEEALRNTDKPATYPDEYFAR